MLKVTSTGVGVGVTPSAKLHVNGDSYFATDMGIGMMASSTYRLSVSDTNNTPLQLQSTSNSLNLTLGSGTQTSYTNILFNSSSGNAQIWKNGGSNSDYGGTGSLNLYNSNGAIAFHPGANQNEVVIHSDGDVDIAENLGVGGAHSGSYKLYVNGTSYVNGRTTLGAAGATEGGAVINYAAFGEIKGGAQTMIGNAVVPGTANNTIQHSKSDAGNYIRMVYSEGIAFHTNITNTVNTDVAVGSSNERMRIDLNGDVDILNRLGVGGTHSGSYGLYVHGTSYFANTLTVGTGNSIQLVTSGGNTRGFIQATDTNNAHLIIATSGGEDICFRDSGLSGTTNMTILGNGDIKLNGYGSGSRTGTVAKYLAVKDDGVIIEDDLDWEDMPNISSLTALP
jgi:hypothetical protein